MGKRTADYIFPNCVEKIVSFEEKERLFREKLQHVPGNVGRRT